MAIKNNINIDKNSIMIKNYFETAIFKQLHNLEIKNERLCVAVSGGSDSLALTLALNFLKTTLNIDILAVLVNHNLRPEAGEEIKQTIKTLEKFHINYIVKEWDGKYQKNLEAEARKNRYKLLFSVCKDYNIKYLCIGHHIDDQVETFLLNVARGSGLDGMCAMPKIISVNGIKIIRPMLELSKQECRKYLTQLNVKWCEDKSNQNIKYKRNKLRFLLEQIEDRDLITKRVASAVSMLQEVKDVVDNVIDNILTNKEIILFNKDHNEFVIKQEEFLKLKLYIQKSIITKIIIKITNREYKLRLYQIENILDSIKNKEQFKRTLSGCIIEMKKGCIKIYKMA